MENTTEKEEKKQTRRDLLEEWKEKRDKEKSHPHPTSSVKKPFKFEEILRNDAVTFETLRNENEGFEKKKVSMSSKKVFDSDHPASTSSQRVPKSLNFDQEQNLGQGKEVADGSFEEVKKEANDTMESTHEEIKVKDQVSGSKSQEEKVSEPENEIVKNESKDEIKPEETTKKDEKKPLVSCLKSSNSKEPSKLRKTTSQKSFDEKDETNKNHTVSEGPLIQPENKKATGTKKRKTISDNDQLLNERGELKKVHMTQDMEKEGDKSLFSYNSQQRKPKSEEESSSFADVSKNYGSGMRYSIKEIKTGKSGYERVITPVRTSRRISNRSKSPSDNQRKMVSGARSNTPQEEQTNSKLSVTFMEDSEDIRYVHNDIEDIFRPVDDETCKLKEMIRKRRPTPYSKSTKKPDEETDEEEERSLNQSFKSGGENSHSKSNKENGIEFEKVIDPDVRGNGNYALVEIKASSAKKFGAKRAITPLKDITKEKLNEAAEDVKFITKNQETDIGYIPRNSEIAKKLESLF